MRSSVAEVLNISEKSSKVKFLEVYKLACFQAGMALLLLFSQLFLRKDINCSGHLFSRKSRTVKKQDPGRREVGSRKKGGREEVGKRRKEQF